MSFQHFSVESIFKCTFSSNFYNIPIKLGLLSHFTNKKKSRDIGKFFQTNSLKMWGSKNKYPGSKPQKPHFSLLLVSHSSDQSVSEHICAEYISWTGCHFKGLSHGRKEDTPSVKDIRLDTHGLQMSSLSGLPIETLRTDSWPSTAHTATWGAFLCVWTETVMGNSDLSSLKLSPLASW